MAGGFQVFCIEPDLGYCDRLIADHLRRDTLTGARWSATSSGIDAALTIFSRAARGAPVCDLLMDSCDNPAPYPAAGTMLRRVEAQGMSNVEIRAVVPADPVPRGTPLIGAVRLPEGCIIIALGDTLTATAAGRLSSTGNCLPNP